MLSTYVLVEVTRIETKTAFLVAVYQVFDVTHNRVNPVCGLGNWGDNALRKHFIPAQL